MSNKLRLIALTLLISVKMLIFLSCAPSYKAFQIIETNSNEVAYKEGIYAYEKDEVELSYNFWQGKPIINFTIFNKSPKPIYIDFDKSHFILNGESYDYYEDIEQVSSVSSAKGVSSYYNYGLLHTNSIESQVSTKYKRKRIVQIPPKSYIRFSDNVNLNYSIDNCETAIIKKGNPYILTFEEKNSPVQFRNYITYSTDVNMSNLAVIDNDFWVSKVMIVNEEDFKTVTDDILYNCEGYKQEQKVYSYPYQNPKSIYYQFKHNTKTLTSKKKAVKKPISSAKKG